ncbi:endonuclease/exonuclease/phosphatase family protein [Streptomyces lincolnensis]|uniref:endonuclease/exonuclease/phosphatase family protein n=1 Tax=Streptomyces lincolnensis TaxID=1915 RepID=UPI001E5BF685|nr:endonuclease/exonuclease/phosphatase family protein [Streptomyces lincolnensis]MCD7437190.1 endonuclease/exonuclease/phosphatase family protein [Streptomyces lincolnensis]
MNHTSRTTDHTAGPLSRRATLAAFAGAALAGASALPAAAQPAPATGRRTVRFATFNASLNRGTEGALVTDLSTPDNAQARNAAETIQRVDPDVLLVNEFDHDDRSTAAALFQRNYLSVGQSGARPIRFPYRFTAPVNTGVASGVDLDGRNGAVTTPGSDAYGQDAFGYGLFPGQYGMLVLSKYPIDTRAVRTFQRFLWKDMPENVMPEGYYSAEARAILRLSSKSHWDVPVRLGHAARDTVHFLVSHPTPPTFDGPEDRNGRRNHDEIRLWADYISGRRRSAYLYDDQGVRGGLRPGARFVIAGDLNADPFDGDSYDHAVRQLLDHPAVRLPRTAPSSAGGVEAARVQGGANAAHRGNPAYDTADFGDGAPGNLRVDHVIPSRGLIPRANGVFWPTSDDPLYRLVGNGTTVPTSDHRLVWQDVQVV